MWRLKRNVSEYPSWLLYMMFLFLSILCIYFTFISNGKLYAGDDVVFHMGRIEGLSRAIQQGDYFPKINYYFLFGMGYASSIFYPDLFLYPAALFRVVGFTITQSYILYMILINFLTFVSGYYSFLYGSKNKTKSLFFAVIYGLASYRLCDVIVRGALGETLAFLFLPVVILGTIQIVQGDYRKFFFLGIGMAGIFYAHLLSTVIFSMFIGLYFLLNIRKLVNEKQRISYFLLSIALTIILVSPVLFPLLEQLMYQQLNVQTKPIFYLQNSASSLFKYLNISINNTGFNNLGIFIFSSMGYLILCVKKITTTSKQMLIIGSIFLFVTTDSFPHALFHNTLLNTIQFTWRYFMIISTVICWALADSLDQLLPKKSVKFVSIIVFLFMIIQSISYQMNAKEEKKFLHKDFENPNPAALGNGKEYLPINMDFDRFINNPHNMRAGSKKIKLINLKRGYDFIRLDYDAPEETTLTFPLTFYKGYTVKSTGDPLVRGLQNSKENVGLSEVVVKGKGQLAISYTGTKIQKIAKIPAVVLIVVSSVLFLRKRQLLEEKNNMRS
ncbi:hypothetical protein [Candidatus Enterococcus ikei]|uniref:Membrane protein 6-pyruvoyl-tetrahydropterin synthase-related domain-containing protein n=1 Tax=Candidatus Enterococcus ikei TaxID=2815326 RepID=A0ABS3GXA3_9ENTE|nr:hypothetical protein [Enterococcus sp. DIV0869a]MBO0439867.1 hypothetical protein [Enterococcus sp. DIV0869a]